MKYPIFNSFVNKIKSELTKKDIDLKTFRTWDDDRINAKGLEIVINVNDKNNFIDKISINFDWDRFRETVLAQQLNGLGEHPMLQEGNLESVTVSPKIDIELSWIFDQEKIQMMLSESSHPEPLKDARNWMNNLSKKANDLLAEEESMTRWHIEIDGNADHKYISAITLISYFQYSLTDLKSLNEVLRSVRMRIHQLMIKSKIIRQLSESTLKNVA